MSQEKRPNTTFVFICLDGQSLSKFYSLGLVEFLYSPLSIAALAVSI